MDSTTASFLLESLRPYAPVIPHPDDPREYLNYGFATANQLNANALAGQRLALGAEQLRLLPMDRKYKETDAALQAAQLDIARANARRANAAADLYLTKVNQYSAPLPPWPAMNLNGGDGNYLPLNTGAPSDVSDLPQTDPVAAPADDSTDFPAPPVTIKTGVEDQDSVDSSVPVFQAKATGYHPVAPSDPNYKMEGGSIDALGHPIHTLDAYRRGEAPDVTVAIDKSSPLFGKSAYSPELGAPVKFTDTGSAFKGKGNSRVDVARDSAAGANSDENNGNLTFKLAGSEGAPATIPAAGASNAYDVSGLTNGPFVEVNNLFGPDGAARPSAIVAAGAPAQGALPKGIHVPSSIEDARDQRNAFEQRKESILSDPAFVTNPKNLHATQLRLQQEQAGIARAEAMFQQRQMEAQRAAALAARAGTRTGAGGAVSDTDLLNTLNNAGMAIKGATVRGLGVNYQMEMSDPLDRFQKEVKTVTGTDDLGALKAGFKGHVNPETGFTEPDNVFFQIPGSNGLPVSRAVPSWWYEQQFIPKLNQIFGYKGNAPAQPADPSATSPNMLTVADEAKRIGGAGSVVPVKLTMGGRRGFVPDPSYAPPVSTAPAAPAVPSTPPVIMPSKLEAAAADVEPQTQVEKVAVASRQQYERKQAEQAQAKAKADADKVKATAHEKTMEGAMEKQVTSLQNQIASGNQYLNTLQFPVRGPAPDPDAVGAQAHRIALLRARLKAASDPMNYKQKADGSFRYDDPFDAEPRPTSFNQIDSDVGMATVKKN